MTTGLEEDVEGFGADNTIEDDDSTLEPQTEQVDPVTALADRVTKMEEIATRLKDFDPTVVARGLGQVRSLQSKIDSLSNADPLSTINPRVSTNEEIMASVVEALVASDLLDDTSKNSLRVSLTKLSQSKTDAEWARRERELLSKVQSTTDSTQTPQGDSELAAYVQDKTAELKGYARAKGVEFTSLPQNELQFRPGETVDQAYVRVVSLIDEKANESSATDRLAGRRKAAGGGSPSRAGGTDNIEQDRERAMRDGIPITDDAARKRLAAALGVSL